jgi:eukaryotic translation initiation factor 2C
MHTLSVCTPARYADLLCDRLRMYMRPALSKNASVPDDDNPEAIMASYRQNVEIWGEGRNGQTGRNPWHQNLNNVMFYL